MPNRQEHLAIGVGVVAVLIIIIMLSSDEHSVPTLAELLGFGTGTVVGSVSPDIIEPATTPNHRGAAHSIVALGFTAKILVDPLEEITRLRRGLREAAELNRAQRNRLPLGHPDRAGLWIAEQSQLFAAGFVAGFPLGYASHLTADGWDGRLPLMT